MQRTGKIARLPFEIREELNKRVLNCEYAADLVAWLNSLPVVQSFLAERWDGVPISEQNLSNWREGGFVDWCLLKDWQITCSACVDDSSKIAATGIDAGKLLIMLTGRLAVALDYCDNDVTTPVPEDPALHKLIGSVLRIRQNELKEARMAMERELKEARLALDRERLEFEREKHLGGGRDDRSGGAPAAAALLPGESGKPEPVTLSAEAPSPQLAAPNAEPPPEGIHSDPIAVPHPVNPAIPVQSLEVPVLREAAAATPALSIEAAAHGTNGGRRMGEAAAHGTNGGRKTSSLFPPSVPPIRPRPLATRIVPHEVEVEIFAESGDWAGDEISLEAALAR